MRKYFQIAKGFVYFLAELGWFFIVAVPLALTIYLFFELVYLIKSIYNQIKSVCKKISMK
jgi:hypothetical protein